MLLLRGDLVFQRAHRRLEWKAVCPGDRLRWCKENLLALALADLAWLCDVGNPGGAHTGTCWAVSVQAQERRARLFAGATGASVSYSLHALSFLPQRLVQPGFRLLSSCISLFSETCL